MYLNDVPLENYHARARRRPYRNPAVMVDNLGQIVRGQATFITQPYSSSPFEQRQQLVAMRPSSTPTQSLPAIDYTSQIIQLQQQIGQLMAKRASLPSIGSGTQIQALNAQIMPMQQQLQRLQSQQVAVSRPTVQRAGIEAERLQDEQVALKVTSQPTIECGRANSGKWSTFLSVASAFGVPIPPDASGKPGMPIFCSARQYAQIQAAMAEANLTREIAQTSTASAQQMEVDRLIGGFQYRSPKGYPDYFAAMDNLTSVLTNDLFSKGVAARKAQDSGTSRKYVQGAIQNALNGIADRSIMDSLTRDVTDHIDRWGRAPEFAELSAMVQKYILKPSPKQDQLQQKTTGVPIRQLPSVSAGYGTSPAMMVQRETFATEIAPAPEKKAPNWLLPVLAVGGVALYAFT